MFSPTHVLIARNNQQTPVQLVARENRCQLYTEKEWLENRKPAFEMDPKLGFFCCNVQVVGFRLQPIASQSAIAAQTQQVASNP